MADAKYKRLFTEDDMVQFANAMTHECAGMDRGMGEDRVRSELGKFEGKFPADEPLFLLRGQDELAEDTIVHYESDAEASGCDENFLAGVNASREAFEQFRKDNPDRTKLPD